MSDKTLLHIENCCTQKLLQTETCILRTEAFTQRSPCRQMLFTQKVTEAIAHRHLFHTEAFTRRDRYKLQLPQTDAFTLHTKAFTQKKLLRTDAATRGHFSTQRPCYTTKFWHREALTYRSFCSQTSWHTEAFTHAQSSFTDRRTFFTEKLLETWKAFTTTPYKVTRRQKKMASISDTHDLHRGLCPRGAEFVALHHTLLRFLFDDDECRTCRRLISYKPPSCRMRTYGAIRWFRTMTYYNWKHGTAGKTRCSNRNCRYVRKASLPDILVWYLELRWPTPGIRPVGSLHS